MLLKTESNSPIRDRANIQYPVHPLSIEQPGVDKGANMCDQDHFEDDRQQYEALGLVTRKQFGVMLGAGMAMMLPQVANAVAVTESDVNVIPRLCTQPTLRRVCNGDGMPAADPQSLLIFS